MCELLQLELSTAAVPIQKFSFNDLSKTCTVLTIFSEDIVTEI